MLDIIDVGMGNIRSITNVIARLGLASNLISNPNNLSSDILLLPGVGSAQPFMHRIRSRCFDMAINDHVKRGKRIIGICLGFQVMTEFSEEDGGTECLGLIKAQTVSLNKYDRIFNHNQWEQFSLRKEELFLLQNHTSLVNHKKRVIKGRVFYNHEYGVEIPRSDLNYKPINTETLRAFASMYCNGNIIGIQFHPEKSQKTGVDLLSFIL
jgi:glutamine amidotransferase